MGRYNALAIVIAALVCAAPTSTSNTMGCTCEVLSSDQANHEAWQTCDTMAGDKRAVPADCNGVPMPLNCDELQREDGSPFWCCYF